MRRVVMDRWPIVLLCAVALHGALHAFERMDVESVWFGSCWASHPLGPFSNLFSGAHSRGFWNRPGYSETEYLLPRPSPPRAYHIVPSYYHYKLRAMRPHAPPPGLPHNRRNLAKNLEIRTYPRWVTSQYLGLNRFMKYGYGYDSRLGIMITDCDLSEGMGMQWELHGLVTVPMLPHVPSQFSCYTP